MVAVTFVNKRQTNIITTKEDLIKEINHYQAYWLSSVEGRYSNTKGNVIIIVDGLDEELKSYLSSGMR